MFSTDNEKRWSTAAATALLAACSMHVVRQQRKPSRRFVNGSSHASSARMRPNATDVAQSVSVSCAETGRTHTDIVWSVDSGGPKKPFIRWKSRYSYWKRQFWRHFPTHCEVREYSV